MFLPSLGLYWPYLQHFNFKIKMGGFFVTILQYLYILNVFIFPCSPFWLTCNENIVLSSKVMLLSLCLHYTWLYYLYHICFLLFFGYYSCMISGLQMLHVLGRLASVIFLATCVTSDDPALYTCQPGTTPQGVTPAPNRETMFLTFLPIIPIFIYILFYMYFVMPTRILIRLICYS